MTKKTTKKSKPKGRGGRPTKYAQVDQGKVKKLASYGLTDVQIADFLKVSES